VIQISEPSAQAKRGLFKKANSSMNVLRAMKIGPLDAKPTFNDSESGTSSLSFKSSQSFKSTSQSTPSGFKPMISGSKR
jgi:hypothetical protein